MRACHQKGEYAATFVAVPYLQAVLRTAPTSPPWQTYPLLVPHRVPVKECLPGALQQVAAIGIVRLPWSVSGPSITLQDPNVRLGFHTLPLPPVKGLHP